MTLMIWSVCVFPDGRLATGDADGCTRVFDCDGDLLWETLYSVSGLCVSVLSMCVLPNGNLFITSRDDGANILSSSGLYLMKFTDDIVMSSCVLPNGNVCACIILRLHASLNLLASRRSRATTMILTQNVSKIKTCIAEEQEDEFEDVVGEVDSCSQGS